MPVVLAFTALCFAAVWTFFAATAGSVLSWLAVLAALDIAWFVRRLGWPFRDSRAVASMLFTALTIALANGWMASVLFATNRTLNLWQALPLMFTRENLFKIHLMNTSVDWFWYALAIFLASHLASRADRKA